jgi:multicomponent Na+:H+ antiporter subunit E
MSGMTGSTSGSDHGVGRARRGAWLAQGDGIARSWPMAIALVVMWIDLWARLSFANVLSGMVVAWGVLLLARGVRPRPVRHFRLLPALRYLMTFLKQLAIANYQVTLAVIQPERIAPGIIAVPMRYVSDAVVTLVANSITLTPGTLTLETERDGDAVTLYVHALNVTDIEGVRDDIRGLERLALNGFGERRAQMAAAARRGEVDTGAERDEAADRHASDDRHDGEGGAT